MPLGKLAEQIKQLSSVVGGADFSCLEPRDALVWVRELGVACSVFQAALGRAQLQVEATRAYELDGWRDCSSFVAAANGLSVFESRRSLSVARRGSELSSLDSALRSGTLSSAQAALVADGARDDSSAARLIDFAKRQPLSALAREVQIEKESSAELEQRDEARRHSARRCRTWTDSLGMVNVHAVLTPQVGARVVARLKRERDVVFREKRSQGICDSSEQNMVDAFGRLFEGNADGVAAGAKTKRFVDARLLIDYRALKRGWRGPGETCEIQGCGQVSVEVAKELLGDSMFRVLVVDGKDVKTVSSKSRYWKSVVKEAIEFRDVRCSVPGCNVKSFLEKDHARRFSQGGPTSYENGRHLCSHHHRLVTYKGFRLIEVDGELQFVPPGQLVGLDVDVGPSSRGDADRQTVGGLPVASGDG